MVLNNSQDSQKPAPPSGVSPSGSGERKEGLIGDQEKVPIVERVPPKEFTPPVKDYLTQVETGEEIQLPQPVTDDTGQVIVDTPVPQQVTVTLPLTEEEMKRGLHQKVIESLRWLAEWCKRLAKIIGGKFAYKAK